MSKNRNRKKLYKAKNNREYNIIFLRCLYPPYFEYDFGWKHNMPNHKYRSYKTWKYNRKYRYKM